MKEETEELMEFKYSITYLKSQIDKNLQYMHISDIATIERTIDDIKERYLNKDENIFYYVYGDDIMSLRNDISKFLFSLAHYNQYNIKLNKKIITHKSGLFNRLKKFYVNEVNFNLIINDKEFNIKFDYNPNSYYSIYNEELFNYLATIVEYNEEELTLNFKFKIYNN